MSVRSLKSCDADKSDVKWGTFPCTHRSNESENNNTHKKPLHLVRRIEWLTRVFPASKHIHGCESGSVESLVGKIFADRLELRERAMVYIAGILWRGGGGALPLAYQTTQ